VKRQFDLAALAGSLFGGNRNPNGSKPWDSIITLKLDAPSKVEKIKPLMRADATRQKLWYGPYTLPEVSVSLWDGKILRVRILDAL
jgi:hypothetical protein